jgi:hypothetical protein
LVEEKPTQAQETVETPVETANETPVETDDNTNNTNE